MITTFSLSTQNDKLTSFGTTYFPIEGTDISAVSFKIVSDTSFWSTVTMYDNRNKLRGQFVSNQTKEKQFITKLPTTTSFSCIPGIIESGMWYMDYQIASKSPNSTITIEVETYSSTADIPTHENESWTNIEEKNSLIKYYDSLDSSLAIAKNQWFAGDFHTHTIASDGHMTIEENQISANNMGLDFYIATDHNLVPTQWASGNTTVFPGIEVTSTLGHFNLLWVDDFVFDTFSIHDIEDAERLLNLIKTYRNRALISINHPFLTVWKWLLHDLPLNWIDSIELMNDPTYPANKSATHQALLFWNQLLNDGYKITGIGGSDSHLKPDDSYPESLLPSLIGDPKTTVLSKSLSPKDLKESVKAGRVNISRFGQLDVNYNDYFPGEVRPFEELLSSPTINIKVYYSFSKDSIYEIKPLIQIVIDGNIIAVVADNHVSYTHTFENLSDDNYHWIRIQIINWDDEVLAISNPLFYGSKQTSYQKWGDVLNDLPDTTPDN